MNLQVARIVVDYRMNTICEWNVQFNRCHTLTHTRTLLDITANKIYRKKNEERTQKRSKQKSTHKY